jgi:lipopolysaccharide transport system ATP-binding protein
MSSGIAIRVNHLSKLYHIGALQQRHDTLKDALSAALRAPLDRLRGQTEHGTRNTHHAPNNTELATDLWALRDVSFEVQRGEIVGVIGRNGAGKSTLLKILSRITEPTEGRAEIHGRVGSLLEVGTGFHPELTGRDNIYLNGAILGMRRAEIARRFDEIVAFSEIEKFLDTPVKRYSSGMYVRLAFGVAAHLEPEILLVDEVLAVGDAAFQKKCLGKMGDVAREGRTVLFVSHNLAAIEGLCSSAILIDGGVIAQKGTASAVVTRFQESLFSNTISSSWADRDRPDRRGDGSIRIASVSVEDLNGSVIRCYSRLRVAIGYECDQEISDVTFLVGIYDTRNVGIFLLSTEATEELPRRLPSTGCVVCTTDEIALTPGRCYINVAIQKGSVMADYVPYAAYFDVEEQPVFSTGKVPPRSWVMCLIKQKWALAPSE